ncbi:MAG: polysaccharide deacetylase family protein [Chitinivibrionales bacterium]|nr:polysaccharide deacetylase family protein [Chitinivibrionales bacterium]
MKHRIVYSIFFLNTMAATAVFSQAAKDFLLPSQTPPGKLSVSNVPMFVSFGFDDNGKAGKAKSGGEPSCIAWIVSKLLTNRTNPKGSGNAATYDGTPCKATFYMTATYGATEYIYDNPMDVKKAWNNAYTLGHEVGNHTFSHNENSSPKSVQSWQSEIDRCNEWLTKPAPPDSVEDWDESKFKIYGAGVKKEDIHGFRCPRLELNNSMFNALRNTTIMYDCSIEEGWQQTHDGTNFLWPYTLDQGSPGWELLVQWSKDDPDIPDKESLQNYPGFWEMPVHPVIVPPDDKCEQYGVPRGLRASLQKTVKWFDIESGKITGLDYNMVTEFKMKKAELLATLKYTLDLRLQGNRCPFMFGAHGDLYTAGSDLQAAIAEFIDYALSKPDVRIVPVKKILDWLRKPAGLDGSTGLTSDERVQPAGVSSFEVLGRAIRIQSPAAAAVTLYDIHGRTVFFAAVSSRVEHFIVLPASLASGRYMAVLEQTGSTKGRQFLSCPIVD